MATTKTLPFQVELLEADYLMLLTQAKRQTRVAARLVAAVELERKPGTHVFTGFLTDGLALKAIAFVHAPNAVPAIERALKRAREK